RRAREDAGRWFNDWGIPENAKESFANAVVALDGKMPNSAWLQTNDMAGAYSLAQRRLINRSNQDPKIADRPAGATGLSSMLFQLMSFNYSVAKNVLTPMFKRIEFNYGRAKMEAQQAGAGALSSRIQGLVAGGGSSIHAA